MGSILTATVSVYLVMFLGLALATRGFVGESFWPAAQKLNYFVFLPVLFAHTLATAELGGLRVVGLILGVVVTLAIGGLAVGLWQNRTDGRHDLTPNGGLNDVDQRLDLLWYLVLGRCGRHEHQARKGSKGEGQGSSASH